METCRSFLPQSGYVEVEAESSEGVCVGAILTWRSFLWGGGASDQIMQKQHHQVMQNVSTVFGQHVRGGRGDW